MVGLTRRQLARGAFARVLGERRVKRAVRSVRVSSPDKASLTACEVGKALAIEGSSSATAVPFTASA